GSLRRPYRALYRGQERLDGVRARGDHLEDLRRAAVLLPAAGTFRRRGGGADRQRFRQGRAAAPPDGVRGRGAEADLHQPGGKRRLVLHPEVLAQRASKDDGPEIAAILPGSPLTRLAPRIRSG